MSNMSSPRRGIEAADLSREGNVTAIRPDVVIGGDAVYVAGQESFSRWQVMGDTILRWVNYGVEGVENFIGEAKDCTVYGRF